MPNLLHSFVCHCSQSWWLQRTVNDDSKISLLHCTCQFWAQFHIGSCNYFSTLTFIYMAAPLPTFLQFIWFCDVILHILTIDATSGNSRENSMTGKLGDLIAHSFFQTTNDFWTDCSFFNRIYPSISWDNAASFSLCWKALVMPYLLITWSFHQISVYKRNSSPNQCRVDQCGRISVCKSHDDSFSGHHHV